MKGGERGGGGDILRKEEKKEIGGRERQCRR